MEAVLERVTFAREDTGYTIARVAIDRTGPDPLTEVGQLLGAGRGELAPTFSASPPPFGTGVQGGPDRRLGVAGDRLRGASDDRLRTWARRRVRRRWPWRWWPGPGSGWSP